jgi:hypothetical protein
MIKYYSKNKTIKLIQTGEYNCIRLGDGEFRILCNLKCATPFQMITPKLKSKLEEIIKEVNENYYKNLIISLCRLQHKKPWYYDYMKKNMNCENIYHDDINISSILKYNLKNKNIVYISSYLSDIEINNFNPEITDKSILFNEIDMINILDIKDSHHPDIIRIKKIMKISDNWRLDFINHYNNLEANIKKNIDNRNCYFSNGNIKNEFNRFFDSVEHIKSKEKIENYFKKVKVKKIDYIETYFRCSFEQYDYIFNTLLKYDDNWIFLFATGPTGKVIAMDLIKKGITNRIYDFGQKI